MRKLFLFTITALAAVLTGAVAADAQATGQGASPAAGAAARPAQQHLIGEVTEFDPTTGRVTVKTDAGASVSFATGEKTLYRRVPPGQTSLENAERITRADVRAGDRVLVPGGASLAEGEAARQVIVMAREGIAARRDQEREDWRRRGLNGRVVALDAAKREITVETRGRENAQSLTVAASDTTRFRRYAADSLRPADAVAGTFADIQVGDQLRALGERSADNSRFTAEEIISGSVTRASGVISSVDAARGELSVKNEQTGQTVTVALGKNTTLRRIPREVLEEMTRQREQRRQERGETGAGEDAGAQRRERRERRGQGGGERAARDGERPGEGERGRRGGGGRNMQQMFENLPAITLADLKKGDAVVITGTGAAGASRVTAASLVTGDAEFFRLLQRFLRGSGDQRNMSTGLPGDVIGGNTGSRDQP